MLPPWPAIGRFWPSAQVVDDRPHLRLVVLVEQDLPVAQLDALPLNLGVLLDRGDGGGDLLHGGGEQGRPGRLSTPRWYANRSV